MPTSVVDANSLLAIDVGEISTRASLFDVVDGRYRFLACGTTPTTVQAPFFNAHLGVRSALDHLQSITGRVLVGPEGELILPERADGTGVATAVVTVSAGLPLKTVVVGLLEDVSLESARRLAATIYTQVVECISLNDKRKPEDRLDAILRIRPDLVIATGGIEGGAFNSVLKLLETVGLASYLLPEGHRPEVLFAGNEALQEDLKATMSRLASLHFAPNIRPEIEIEKLEPAQSRLAELYRLNRRRQIPGLQELDSLTKGGLMPTAQAFGRIIRFLSKIYTNTKGVLGVDVGASATTFAAAFDGGLHLGVYPQFGLGRMVAERPERSSLQEINQWLPMDLPENVVRNYLYTKATYPATLPVTVEDLAMEQALARTVMQAAARKTAGGLPANLMRYGPNLLPWFEPIVASGSVLTRAPNHAQTMLMLLDGLQPTGVTTVVVDQYHLAASLGAIAGINPTLAVQVLETGTFLNLGTVVSPLSSTRPGTPILRVRMTTEDGHETNLDVKQGGLEMLPLSHGQPANLHLQPLHRSEIGMGSPGRGGSLRVVGGMLGVVIDARGRPVRLPEDPGSRRELIKKWLWTLGGSFG